MATKFHWWPYFFYIYNPIRLKTVKNLQRYEKSATFALSKEKTLFNN